MLEMPCEFEGVAYEKLRDMQRARRERNLEHLREGVGLAQAAGAVGVSKRAGKVWRNGRTRLSGRDERALVDRYSGGAWKNRRGWTATIFPWRSASRLPTRRAPGAPRAR